MRNPTAKRDFEWKIFSITERTSVTTKMKREGEKKEEESIEKELLVRSRQFRRSLGLQFRGSFLNATVGPERERFRVRVHSRAGALAVVVVVPATTTSFRAFPRSLRIETRQCVVLSTARSRHGGSIRLIRLRKREKKKREEEENGEPRDREPSRLIPSRAPPRFRREEPKNRTGRDRPAADARQEILPERAHPNKIGAK